MVAVIALSIVAPYLAPVTWGVGAGTLGGTLISAGIAIAGQLAISALVPPPSQNLGSLSGTDRESSPTLSGARNQPIPFGVVAGLLGRFKQTPPLAGRTYTELVGDDQYLRLLASWGLGLRHFAPFKIGPQLLSGLDRARAETR